ncbi:endonuclease V N-glycosylase UV repair enzyme [Rhizobium phage vB_RleM_P10VF]|uniref:Putative endonuclease n=1 Tax=Rhizobium phage vB_RleM_P10VF TaxID=1527770 RepID=A0A076YLS9_9CAUD|nr:endonuclease V N-glycosylase UV repair enzyme [Rhizobium phage vB_RleM_P10VF]AIK68285.1 putative endonuclease [Rhizobium phage vB_RleM_P10VF]
MTRINLIPPKQLHPKHLQGEYFELPRVFTAVQKAILKNRKPEEFAHLTGYRMGTGHVQFFYPRLHFLEQRFKLLVHELFQRNVNINRFHLSDFHIPIEWFGSWSPTEAEIEINRQRINARLLTMRDGERWIS